ncbi:hypothetical protein [Comamonas badia]|uniref:hypothetical protein n=1 Tax=Comamonas badia TaxID=265291 RepID=UPI0012EC9250|nr:hypothetical protein [Comamonas badia]
MFGKSPQLGDTPPDGDFARYVERLSGAVPPPPGVQSPDGHAQLPGATTAPGQQGSKPVGRRAATPIAVKRAGGKSRAATNARHPSGFGFLLAVFALPIALSWLAVWWMPELEPVQGLIAFALIAAAVVLRLKQAVRRRTMAGKDLRG